MFKLAKLNNSTNQCSAFEWTRKVWLECNKLINHSLKGIIENMNPTIGEESNQIILKEEGYIMLLMKPCIPHITHNEKLG